MNSDGKYDGDDDSDGDGDTITRAIDGDGGWGWWKCGNAETWALNLSELKFFRGSPIPILSILE